MGGAIKRKREIREKDGENIKKMKKAVDRCGESLII